jgi:hypothetical protein
VIHGCPAIDLGALSGCERARALEAFEGIAICGSLEISGRCRLALLFREIAHLLDQLDKLRLTTDCGPVLQIFDQAVEPIADFRNHYRKEEAVLYPLMEKCSAKSKREIFCHLSKPLKFSSCNSRITQIIHCGS